MDLKLAEAAQYAMQKGADATYLSAVAGLPPLVVSLGLLLVLLNWLVRIKVPADTWDADEKLALKWGGVLLTVFLTLAALAGLGDVIVTILNPEGKLVREALVR